MDIKKYVSLSKTPSHNYALMIKDLVGIDSYLSATQNHSYPTDYAIVNGVTIDKNSDNKQICAVWTDSEYKSHATAGFYNNIVVRKEDELCFGICPSLLLNVKPVVYAQKRYNLFKITQHGNGDNAYYTIQFGKFPKTYVGNKLNEKLEKMFLLNLAKETGKEFIGKFKDGKPTFNKEYIIDGQRYVRALNQAENEDTQFLDGSKVQGNNAYSWLKVEPIEWRIENWDFLPKEINENGINRSCILVLRADAIMAGIPFYTNNQDDNRGLWQNSTIRGYLNGLNVNNLKENGDVNFTASNGGDWTNHNFITQALEEELTQISNQILAKDEDRKI